MADRFSIKRVGFSRCAAPRSGKTPAAPQSHHRHRGEAMNRTDFHEGERSVQGRAGETGIADRNIAIRSDTVIGGARAFVGLQFMVAIGSVDATGRVWASLLFGKPGFVETGDGHAISIAMPPAARDPVDP